VIPVRLENAMKKKTSWVAALVPIALLCWPQTSFAEGRGDSADTLRYPYREGAVYRVKLVPGAPFVVELPSGEGARAVWRDPQYWHADWVAGATRVIIRPLDMSEVIGRRGFIHIETTPSNLRISLRVEAVRPNIDVPGVLRVYLTEDTAASPMQRQVRQAVDAELPLVRKHVEAEERQKYEAFKRQLLSSFRDDYDWGGDFRITKVIDNSLQTFVTVPGGNDTAVIQFVTKGGQVEIVEYEFDAKTGVYTLANKVLRKGEKLRLVLGKEKAWIALK
jgi:hypothetical protein